MEQFGEMRQWVGGETWITISGVGQGRNQLLVKTGDLFWLCHGDRAELPSVLIDTVISQYIDPKLIMDSKRLSWVSRNQYRQAVQDKRTAECPPDAQTITADTSNAPEHLAPLLRMGVRFLLMRRYLDILMEDNAAKDHLDAAFGAIARYTSENLYPDDWHGIATVLRRYGYREPVEQLRFYRVLFHPVTAAERARHATIGSLFAEIEREVRFELTRPQGFTTSFDQAINFLHNQYNIMWYRQDWPTQTPDKPLADHGNHSLAVIYEAEARPSQFLWSMRGLSAFLRDMESTGPGYEALLDGIGDEWSGYGKDDEVVIDCSSGVRITGMTLYDSDKDGPAD